MRRRISLLALLAALAGTGGAALAQAAGDWQIGPVIRGRNYSPGMPAQPTARRDGGFQIDLPQTPGSVHYVTFRHGSLAGKRRIVMRYRIEATRGARIVPTTAPDLPSMLTLYFQRAGDNWSGRRAFETYRWYAAFAQHTPLVAGEHVMVVPLTGNWSAIQTSTAQSDPRAFRDAIAQADQVGFVLGGGDGVGHGVHVEGGRARLVVTEFRVE